MDEIKQQLALYQRLYYRSVPAETAKIGPKSAGKPRCTCPLTTLFLTTQLLETRTSPERGENLQVRVRLFILFGPAKRD